MDQWPAPLRGKLNLVDIRSLLSVESVTYGCRVSASSIKHDNAGVGVFTNRRIVEGEVVCYYYGTIVYHDLSGRKEIHKTYGEGVMGVTADRFRKYALEVKVPEEHFQPLPERNNDRANRIPVSLVVPAPFCLGGFINDPKYVEGDKERNAVVDGRIKRREQNVFIRRTPAAGKTPSKLSANHLLIVEALRDMTWVKNCL